MSKRRGNSKTRKIAAELAAKEKEPINDIWQDPNVKAALKERSADDIMVMRCPDCAKLSYYNQGSHFWCRFCERGWYCCGEGEQAPSDRAYLRLDESDCITLADTVTETTDGYHNENAGS